MDAAVYDPFDERYCQTEFRVVKNPATQWERFAIVTACNPLGQPTSMSYNQDYTRALSTTIHERGYDAVQVVGYDPNGQHEEAGYAVDCTVEQARDLSRKYAQLAFYMVEGDHVTLHATDAELSRPVARWSHRLRKGHRP